MIHEQNGDGRTATVGPFVRNRYFYGKLLDVLQFELEQDYINGKRWLLNRLVTGYGVICGLNVTADQSNTAIWVSPGIAIDKWGREIIVPASSRVSLPAPAPPPEQSDPDHPCEKEVVHVCLCYHECEADPVPGLGGDCDQNAMCSPGSIRERFELCVRPGKLPDNTTDCLIPDLVSGNRINYAALAEHISGPCGNRPEDPCIPLANIEFPHPPDTALEINIAIRPIVYTNDLLHDLLVCLTSKPAEQQRGGKN